MILGIFLESKTEIHAGAELVITRKGVTEDRRYMWRDGDAVRSIDGQANADTVVSVIELVPTTNHPLDAKSKTTELYRATSGNFNVVVKS